MNRKSLSQVKNLMRRALRDLVDPPPSSAEQARLREYFQDRCAYCESPAPPRAGHIDHAEHDGGNALGNLILACGKCNGDEKREQTWEDFLRQKFGAEPATYEKRRGRILDWMAANPRPPRRTRPDVDEAMRAAVRSIEDFAAAYDQVRAAVAKGKTSPQ